jgi:hypothetical protein
MSGDPFVVIFGILLMFVDGFCILFKEPQMLQYPLKTETETSSAETETETEIPLIDTC